MNPSTTPMPDATTTAPEAGFIRLAAALRLQVLERGWLSSNSIVFDDGDAVSVIDTGYALHVEQTLALVDAARAGKPVRQIVNTHLHSDHVGGNAALQARHGCPIAIAPGLAAAVAAWDDDALSFAATGQHCPRFMYDRLLVPGERLSLGGQPWEVLAAPGHDPHMVMLFNPAQGVLISADALWANGFGAIFPEIEGESGFAEQRAALALIDECRPHWVIPGHGAPFADVDAALEIARQRLAALAADPVRNARHVARALIKFWLLQVRSAALPAIIAHFAPARYFRVIHARYFAQAPFAAMIERAVDELVAVGAAQRDKDIVHDAS